MRCHRFLLPSLGVVALLGGTLPVLAQDPRFAVVDLSSTLGHQALANEIERQVARLRPDTKPIDDPVMRQLLASGEGPAALGVRLAREADDHRQNGDCVGALDRVKNAEPLILNWLPLDDERDLLKTLYITEVLCASELHRPDQLKQGAYRLRSLVELRPDAVPADIWTQSVATALPGAPTTELQIDSEPGNASVAIDSHGQGVTPRTLKVAPGVVFVEVQKEGYRKAFRAVTVGGAPARAVFRLTERARDRIDQAEGTLLQLRVPEPGKKVQTLSRLAQLARADSLVGFETTGHSVKIWFFDAEKGSMSAAPIQSEFDPRTNRVFALEERRAGAVTAPPAVPSVPAPATGGAAAAVSPVSAPTPAAATPPPTAPVHAADALPEAQGKDRVQSASNQELLAAIRKRRGGPPWWSWVIAGAVGTGLIVFVIADHPRQADTLAVRATWIPPSP